MRYLQGSLALSTGFAEFNDVPVAVRNIAWVAVAVIHSFFTRRADTFGPLAVEITGVDFALAGVAGCRFSGFY